MAFKHHKQVLFSAPILNQKENELKDLIKFTSEIEKQINMNIVKI